MSAGPLQQTREERRSARREAILAAARTVFAQKSFEQATIADIAREAGVASGTVYLYYASKLDLFAALNAELFRIIIQAVQQPGVPPDLRGGTRARIEAIFETSSRHRDLLRLVFLNPDPRSEVARRMKTADEERLRPLAELLSAGIETGIVRNADPKLLARIVYGVVITALYQCFIHFDSRHVDTYVDVVTDMIVGALSPVDGTGD